MISTCTNKHRLKPSENMVRKEENNNNQHFFFLFPNFSRVKGTSVYLDHFWICFQQMLCIWKRWKFVCWGKVNILIPDWPESFLTNKTKILIHTLARSVLGRSFKNESSWVSSILVRRLVKSCLVLRWKNAEFSTWISGFITNFKSFHIYKIFIYTHAQEICPQSKFWLNCTRKNSLQVTVMDTITTFI